MKSTTRKHDSSQPVADTAVYLFDHWFDPIETWRAFHESIWGLMLVVIIIGGIYSGIFTATEAVYVPADDFTDPAVTAISSHLDSMIVLSRSMAAEGMYPAVDPLSSSSILLDPIVIGEEHYRLAEQVRETIAHYRELQDIISPSSFRARSVILNTMQLAGAICVSLVGRFYDRLRAARWRALKLHARRVECWANTILSPRFFSTVCSFLLPNLWDCAAAAVLNRYPDVDPP
jgi:hypothetical protein